MSRRVLLSPPVARRLHALSRLRLPSQYKLVISRMASDTMAAREIKIDITSDSICPFCFIGKRKIERAMEMSKEKGLNLKFNIQYHPFLLDPTLRTDTPVEKRARYEEKFGRERFVQMERQMIQRGKAVGINFSYDGKVRQTTDSHRLIEYAYDKGGEEMQLDLVERLFAGYFEKEKDVGDSDFLAEQAVAAFLFSNIEDAKRWLTSDAKQAEVAKGIKDAQMMGVTGVPFFVLNNKYAISGAQESELFVEVFERLAGQTTNARNEENKELNC